MKYLVCSFFGHRKIEITEELKQKLREIIEDLIVNHNVSIFNRIIRRKEMSNIKVFEDKKVRTEWNVEKEDWWFSVIDVVEILTNSKDFNTARKYWNKLKQRLKEERSELVTFCHRLKLPAQDGKLRETDKK